MTFSPEDLALLTDVLEAHPSMHNTAYAVKIIERKLHYPIPTLETLLGVFGSRTVINVRNCGITPEEVRRLLPESYFPIDNRRHLISHLCMAFEHERMGVIFGLATAQGNQAV